MMKNQVRGRRVTMERVSSRTRLETEILASGNTRTAGQNWWRTPALETTVLRATGTSGRILTREKLLSTWKRCSINLVQSIVSLISRQTIHGGIVALCGSFEITAFNSIITMVMVRPAAQGQAGQEPALVLAAQGLVTRIKAIKEVIINSLEAVANSSITSQVFRATRNSLAGVSIMFSQPALTSETRRYASGRLMRSCRLSRSI
jgi:hypothetical protein